MTNFPLASIGRRQPNFVYGFSKAACCQNIAGFVSRQTESHGNRNQVVELREIHAVDKVRLESGSMDVSIRLLRYDPLGHFLRAATVERHRPVSVRQTFLGHQLNHPIFYCGNVDVPTCKQFFQRHSLVGSVRMEREMHEPNVNLIVRPEPFNTHGTEIAPGSDVVGVNFQQKRVCHRVSPDVSNARECDGPIQGLEVGIPRCDAKKPETKFRLMMQECGLCQP